MRSKSMAKYQNRTTKTKAAPCFTLQISPRYFELVQKQKKTVEGRLAKTRFLDLEKEQTIRLQNSKSYSSLYVKIVYLKKYTSFKEMLIFEGLDKCLPDIQNIEEGIDVYYGFQDYKKMERELGVLAIGIHLLGESAQLE